MSLSQRFLIALALFAAAAAAAGAGESDPLFINLTTDDAHRALMAVGFGRNQLERGHPLTIFLNDRGVFVGARDQAAHLPEAQQALAAVLAEGGTVIACPTCIAHFSIEPAELLPGIQVGSPELTGGALFREGTITLSW